MVKNPPANAGNVRYAGSIPEPERSSGEGNGNPFQYSCLGDSMEEEPGRLHSTWDNKESNATEYAHTHTHTHSSPKNIYFIFSWV